MAPADPLSLASYHPLPRTRAPDTHAYRTHVSRHGRKLYVQRFVSASTGISPPARHRLITLNNVYYNYLQLRDVASRLEITNTEPEGEVYRPSDVIREDVFRMAFNDIA